MQHRKPPEACLSLDTDFAVTPEMGHFITASVLTPHPVSPNPGLPGGHWPPRKAQHCRPPAHWLLWESLLIFIVASLLSADLPHLQFGFPSRSEALRRQDCGPPSSLCPGQMACISCPTHICGLVNVYLKMSRRKDTG